jgi:MafB19-like deaminase
MIQSSSDRSDSAARARTERLLQDANDAAALRHRLALIDIEAQHRLAQHRSHYNPDQPRVPAGHPDGGQWTNTGSTKIGIRLAAGDKPRLPRHVLITIAVELAKRAIEAYRSENGLWDLFRHKEGVVARTIVDGKDVFGVNSKSKAYTSVDRAAAEKLRETLMKKYPEIFSGENIGEMPRNAIFHAETTVLLRAARQNGGALAGQTLTVYVDMETCNNCEEILPYVGLELGNPTVTFVDPKGSMMTIQDGKLIK